MRHAEEPIPEDVTEKALSIVKDKQKFRRQMGGRKAFLPEETKCSKAQKLKTAQYVGMRENSWSV